MRTRVNLSCRWVLSGFLLFGWLTNASGQEKPLFRIRQQQAANTVTNRSNSTKPVVSSNQFKKTKLTGDFLSEGVAVADLNKDGQKTDRLVEAAY